MRLLLLLFVLYLNHTWVNCQVYMMDPTGNNTAFGCSGTFTDDGGLGSDYSGVFYISNYTFCSTPGSSIILDFSGYSFDIDSDDELIIFDGMDAVANIIYTSAAGNLNPGSLQSSGPCLMVKFISSGNSTAEGWGASISCPISCFDGIMNGSETAIDCGGLCLPCSCYDGVMNGNETGIDCGGECNDCVDCDVQINIQSLITLANGCGEVALDLEAQGNGGLYNNIVYNFELGLVQNWTSNVTPDFNNPCGPSYNGGTHIWMGNSSAAPRIIETDDYDLTCGGTICFYMKFGVQADGSPCEGIDVAGEGITLQFSPDGGANWHFLEYYGPNGVGDYTNHNGFDPQMTSWNQYCVNIPNSAMLSNVRFRWAQLSTSGNDYDHWGIDDVLITPDSCGQYVYDWNVIPGANDGPFLSDSIMMNTEYIVNYTNNYNSSCYDTIVIPASGLSITGSISGPDNLCQFDIDSIELIVNGGVPPFTFSYAVNGVPINSLSMNNFISLPVNSSSYGIQQYIFNSVSDSAGCLININDTLLTAIHPSITATFSDSIFLCSNQNDTVISFVFENGFPPYNVTYLNHQSGLLMNQITTSDTLFIPFNVSGAGEFLFSIINATDSVGTCPYLGYDTVFIEVLEIPNAEIFGSNFFCEADSIGQINFIGTNGTSPYIFEYTIDNGISNYIISNDSVGLYTFPLNSQNIIVLELVSVSSANQCKTMIQQTHEIITSPKPVLTMSSNLNLCLDSSDTSYCFVGSNGIAPYYFQWYDSQTGNNNAEWSVGDSLCIPFSSTVAGNYEFIVMRIEDSSVPVCPEILSDTLKINVFERPNGYIAGGGNYCQGDSIGISLVATQGIAPFMFEYSINGTPQFFSSSTNLNNIQVSSLFADTLEIILISIEDSSPAACTSIVNDSVIVVIKEAPDAQLIGGGTFCLGDSTADFQLLLSNTSNMNINVYGNWSYTTTPFSETQLNDSSYNFIFNSVGVYSLILDSISHAPISYCTSIINDTITFNVNPNPTVDAGSNISICDGELISLNYNGSADIVNYSWQPSVLNGVPFYPSIGNQIYFVTVENNFNCFAYDSLNLVSSPSPSAMFYANNTFACDTLISTLFNSSSGDSITNFTWIVDDEITNGTGDSLVVQLSNDVCNNVTLIVENINQCLDTMTIVDYLCVSDSPEASFSYSPNELFVYDNVVEFENFSSGAIGYNWDFGDGTNQDSSFSPIHEYEVIDEDGYSIVLIVNDEFGCTDSAFAFIGINQDLIFYVPNSFTPDGNQFNNVFKPIMSFGFDPYGYTFSIFNRWGQLVFESNDTDYGWDGTYNGEIAQDGTYTWTMEILNSSGNKSYFNGTTILIR